jgi:CBS domain-containing protein
MTANPIVLPSTTTAMEAARAMRNANIGDVIVSDQDNGKIYGIVTDRDLVLRVVAEGKDPRSTVLKNICSKEVASLSPSQTTDDAVKMMSERAIRRLPVVEGSKVLGIVSLGDLAQKLDRRSALGQISAAPPNS